MLGEGEAACSFDEVGAEADELDRKASTLSAEKVPALTLRRICYWRVALARKGSRPALVITCGFADTGGKAESVESFECWS